MSLHSDSGAEPAHNETPHHSTALPTRRLIPPALALGWALAQPAAVDAAPPPGQLLAYQCFQCHGTEGKAVSGFESISGKPAAEMYKKLLEMNRRPAEGIMDVQTRAYTPAQLQLIARYLASLPADPTESLDD